MFGKTNFRCGLIIPYTEQKARVKCSFLRTLLGLHNSAPRSLAVLHSFLSVFPAFRVAFQKPSVAKDSFGYASAPENAYLSPCGFLAALAGKYSAKRI
jgi:hypothetical protein